MPRFKRLWIGFLAGFLCAAYLNRGEDLHFILIGGIFIGPFTMFIQMIFQYIRYKYADPGGSFLVQEVKFMDQILGLTAAMFKANGGARGTDLTKLKYGLTQDFSPEKVQVFMERIQGYLTDLPNVKKMSREIDLEFTYANKINLIHFLITITQFDRILTEREVKVLKAIAHWIGVNNTKLNAILALYTFDHSHAKGSTSEQQRTGQQGQQNAGGRRQQSQRSTQSKLHNAYAIFSLPKTASPSEIKKAYRKLAKQHHPDRVRSKSKLMQENSKVMFQKISEAYEIIKDTRGFK